MTEVTLEEIQEKIIADLYHHHYSSGIHEFDYLPSFKGKDIPLGRIDAAITDLQNKKIIHPKIEFKHYQKTIKMTEKHFCQNG